MVRRRRNEYPTCFSSDSIPTTVRAPHRLWRVAGRVHSACIHWTAAFIRLRYSVVRKLLPAPKQKARVFGSFLKAHLLTFLAWLLMYIDSGFSQCNVLGCNCVRFVTGVAPHVSDDRNHSVHRFYHHHHHHHHYRDDNDDAILNIQSMFRLTLYLSVY